MFFNVSDKVKLSELGLAFCPDYKNKVFEVCNASHQGGLDIYRLKGVEMIFFETELMLYSKASKLIPEIDMDVKSTKHYQLEGLEPYQSIESILEESEFLVYNKVYGNTTIVVAKLPNNFTIVESAGCVNPDNYSEEIGKKICLDKIKKKIWELEGYALQDRIYKTKLEEPFAKENENENIEKGDRINAR